MASASELLPSRSTLLPSDWPARSTLRVPVLRVSLMSGDCRPPCLLSLALRRGRVWTVIQSAVFTGSFQRGRRLPKKLAA